MTYYEHQVVELYPSYTFAERTGNIEKKICSIPHEKGWGNA
jgi:hypothetical protein